MTKLKFATTYSFDYSLTPNSIIECQNGDYIIVGKAHNKDSHSSAFAIRVNYKGNVIWKKIYSSPLPQFFTSIIQTTNGDLVATGIYYYSEYASDEYTWIVNYLKGEQVNPEILAREILEQAKRKSNGRGQKRH